MPMKITSCGITDVGQKRQNNEDNFLINDEINLYVVADGMGGHVGGEFASQIAVTTIEEVIQNVEVDPEATRPDWQALGSSVAISGEKLKYAIRLAGKRIFDRTNDEPELRGMGTTTVAMLFDHNRVFVAHVGDSRAYRIRAGAVNQVTEDHSLVNEQIRLGLITKDAARTHKLKNIITRSVGYQEDVEIDTLVQPVEKGDRFLLCTDGLSNLVEEHEILEVVAANSGEQAAQKLIDLANSRGGDDNITLIIAQVDELDTESTETTKDDGTRTANLSAIGGGQTSTMTAPAPSAERK
ncbi:MAG TPA: Stp1/IreP family PP2C-type Ser/Thr phosphatase [bacterium]|nr:Stp1/IreP family PP2C-type Ser/Thr phosphatase [bacterium]